MIRRTLIAALAVACSLPLVAQRGGGPGGPGGPGGTPRLEFLAGYLSLTDAQKTQAKAIFDAAATSLETLSGTAASARDALTAAVKASATDSEIDRLAAAVGTVHGQMAGVNAKAMVKFRGILTAEQKAKLDDREANRPGRGANRFRRGSATQ